MEDLELEQTEDVTTEPVVMPSAVDELKARVSKRRSAVEDFRATRVELEEVKAVAERNRVAETTGFVATEIAKATWGAAVDLTTEVKVMMEQVSNLGPIDEWVAGAGAVIREGDLDAFSEGVEDRIEDNEARIRHIRELGASAAPANESMAGGAVRGIAQFMVPYVGWSKTFTAANTVVKATTRGFAIDFALFNPDQGNLSNLINELAPDYQNLVTEFMATDPDDNEAVNRLKNGIEGVGLGLGIEGVLMIARRMNALRKGKEAMDEVAEATTPIDDLQATTAVDEVEAASIKIEEEELAAAAARDVAEAPEVPSKPTQGEPEAIVLDADGKPLESTTGAPTAPEVAPKVTDGAAAVREGGPLEDTLRSTLSMTTEQRTALNRMIIDGDEEGVDAMLKSDFNDAKIDWENIESADDIARLLKVTTDVFADHIDEVKGGVQTHQHTQRLANLVGATGEEVHSLFKDVRGDKGIAARFYAAKRTMLSSAREVFRLRDIAKANPADVSARAKLVRSLELHAALQAEVKGAQTEIARALNAMKMMKSEASEGFQEFDAYMRSYGNGDGTKNFNNMVDDLLDAKTLEDLNVKVRTITGAGRVKNAMIEYIINAMLSSPKTHIINVTSNILNTFIYSADRMIAGVGRRVLAGDKAALREAKVDLIRKMSSIGEATKLARQAWADGTPVSDKRQRIEFQTRRAIQMSGDTALAKTVNVIGEIVRIPARALITGDEFFKAINRNAEIAVLAYREADRLAEAKGLDIGTPEYEKFVKEAMSELQDPATQTAAARSIRVQAVEKSRLVTFQEAPRTEFGSSMERWMNSSQAVKLLIAPFFRTPMNILRQGLIDRSPLGFIIKDTRDALKNGGPREKAEILARMTTGIGSMVAAWEFMGPDEDSTFQIVGKVPYQSSEKAAGILDYSMRIGDNWYQYNRLDPLGSWIGMVADAKTATEHMDDEEVVFGTLQGALGGFLNASTNKTWAKSLADLLSLASNMSEATPESSQRALAQFTSGQFGKLIPQFVKSVGNVALGEDERVSTEAWTFIDAMMAQIPVLNQKLPARYDALGRVISYDNSAVSLFNPFSMSENPTNKLDSELMRLDFTLRSLPRTLANGSISLTGAEYSQLTGLVGTVPMGDGNLEQTLQSLVEQDWYDEATEERKVYLIKQRINVARQMARAHILMTPEFTEKFKAARVEKAEALFPQ